MISPQNQQKNQIHSVAVAVKSPISPILSVLTPTTAPPSSSINLAPASQTQPITAPILADAEGFKQYTVYIVMAGLAVAVYCVL
jgi:hypothetical protein